MTKAKAKDAPTASERLDALEVAILDANDKRATYEDLVAKAADAAAISEAANQRVAELQAELKQTIGELFDMPGPPAADGRIRQS